MTIPTFSVPWRTTCGNTTRRSSAFCRRLRSSARSNWSTGSQQRNEAIALFLADYRMPQMNGIEFLSKGMTRYPEAKRVLLTAYADTEAAMRAINEIQLHHYLLKPWDPPEQNLYPVLDDLLEDWLADYRPPFEGIRVLGSRWSPHTYELRDFLAKNSVPYHWLDADTADRDPEVGARWIRCPRAPPLPVLLCEDGDTALPADTGRGCRPHRPAHSRREPVLRPGDRRRGPGRVGRGGLRRLGGAAHRDRGARRSRRPGRPQFAHRKLSRLPLRLERRRSGPPRRGPGAALRRRDPRAAAGRRRASGGPVPDRQAGRWQRAFLPRPADRHRRAVAQTRRARHGAPEWRRRLLRRRPFRSHFLRG